MGTMEQQIPILLTATIDPQGMQGATFSVEERAAMYVDALQFYIKTLVDGPQPRIVFAENSHSLAVVQRQVDSPMVEWVDASGDEYDQSRGKGYNETWLIRKAIAKSDTIQKAGCFFKVTGRLKVLNINALLQEVAKACPAAQFRADCKDHNVYRWLHLPINGHVGECRYWFATTAFFTDYMWKYQPLMHDYEPAAEGDRPLFLAEDAMLAVCRESRGRTGCKDRFRCQARISGKGGHALGKGMSFFYSTDNDSFALRFKCFLRQLLRWLLPFWRC